MARPYSKDLRDRVVGSVAGGRSCRATAALFGVSVASVVKWSQRYRATGSSRIFRGGLFSASLHRTPLRCPEIADPDPISASVCLRIEPSDPSPIRIHPIANALHAVEPKGACRFRYTRASWRRWPCLVDRIICYTSAGALFGYGSRAT